MRPTPSLQQLSSHCVALLFHMSYSVTDGTDVRPWSVSSGRWRHYDPSKHRQPFTSGHNITFQNIRVSNNTALRTCDFVSVLPIVLGPGGCRAIVIFPHTLLLPTWPFDSLFWAVTLQMGHANRASRNDGWGPLNNSTHRFAVTLWNISDPFTYCTPYVTRTIKSLQAWFKSVSRVNFRLEHLFFVVFILFLALLRFWIFI